MGRIHLKIMKVDLHSHSTNSDGTKSVREILTMAQAKGVKVLAITDHDNLKGAEEASYVNEVEQIYSGILVPGIEISTYVGEENVHLLAFFPNISQINKSKLRESLLAIQDSRVYRMKKMVELAQKSGIPITFEEVIDEVKQSSDGSDSPTDVISRPHFARVLVKKNIVADVEEAFHKYIGNDKPFYVSRLSLTYDDWIELVNEEGGVVVWAHPLHARDEDLIRLTSVATHLIENGLDGIELVYDYQGKYVVSEDFVVKGTEELYKFVEKHNLLVTSGGDYHGDVGKLGELELDEKHVHKFLSRLSITA